MENEHLYIGIGIVVMAVLVALNIDAFFVV
jgi:hypothetical protein